MQEIPRMIYSVSNFVPSLFANICWPTSFNILLLHYSGACLKQPLWDQLLCSKQTVVLLIQVKLKRSPTLGLYFKFSWHRIPVYSRFSLDMFLCTLSNNVQKYAKFKQLQRSKRHKTCLLCTYTVRIVYMNYLQLSSFLL